MNYIQRIFLISGKSTVIMDPNAEILSLGPANDYGCYSVYLYVSQDEKAPSAARCFEVIQSHGSSAAVLYEPSTALFRGSVFLKDDIVSHVFERLVL